MLKKNHIAHIAVGAIYSPIQGFAIMTQSPTGPTILKYPTRYFLRMMYIGRSTFHAKFTVAVPSFLS